MSCSAKQELSDRPPKLPQRAMLLELKSKQESLDKDKDEIAVALRKARAALEDVKDRIASVEDLKADAREMEVLEASIASGGQQEDRLRADMRNILTNGWLSPVAQRLRHALDQVVSDNDTAQHRQNEMLNARSRVNMLREQVAGGHCPTCHQALPPADEATVLALKRAEGDYDQLGREVLDEPDLHLERRIRALIDDRTVSAYRAKQDELNSVLSMQYDPGRRLAGIKDRMRDDDASKIRQTRRGARATRSLHCSLRGTVEGFCDRAGEARASARPSGQPAAAPGPLTTGRSCGSLFLQLRPNLAGQDYRAVSRAHAVGGRAHCQ